MQIAESLRGLTSVPIQPPIATLEHNHSPRRVHSTIEALRSFVTERVLLAQSGDLPGSAEDIARNLLALALERRVQSCGDPERTDPAHFKECGPCSGHLHALFATTVADLMYTEHELREKREDPTKRFAPYSRYRYGGRMRNTRPDTNGSVSVDCGGEIVHVLAESRRQRHLATGACGRLMHVAAFVRGVDEQLRQERHACGRPFSDTEYEEVLDRAVARRSAFFQRTGSTPILC